MATSPKVTPGEMKRELEFAVTVNNRLVAAFAHPSDAGHFQVAAQKARPDLVYRIVSIKEPAR